MASYDEAGAKAYVLEAGTYQIKLMHNAHEVIGQPITIADHGMTLEDMAGLDYNDPKWNDLLEQLSVDDRATMIANGGWSTPEIASVGKPATNDLDGPAGINSLISSLKGVSFPSEVIVGSSWNTDLAQRFGTAFGAEAAANHVVGLYAPGMNIHRTPFSGRNFEYYSEDGLLSGKMGAAMSSYSRLGNTWAGASKALLTDVLRNEWGFKGMVVTDSAMGNTSWMDINLALRAGGDMMLCLMGVKPDSSSNTAQQAMRRACHNILYTQANSIAVAAAVDNTSYAGKALPDYYTGNVQNIPDAEFEALLGLLQNFVANSRYQAKLDEQSR